jgi:hypothetical protein
MVAAFMYLSGRGRETESGIKEMNQTVHKFRGSMTKVRAGSAVGKAFVAGAPGRCGSRAERRLLSQESPKVLTKQVA